MTTNIVTANRFYAEALGRDFGQADDAERQMHYAVQNMTAEAKELLGGVFAE